MVTTLNINFEWRRLISDALQSYADSIIRNLDDASVDDFRNKIQALLNDLYTAEIMDNTPVGTIVFWMGAIANRPEKWLACNGATLLIADYPDLAGALDGQYRISGTEIQLPDLRNRFLYGGDNNDDIGDVGGEASVALTVNQLPPHTHNVPSGNVAGNSTSFVTRSTGASPNNNATSSVGAGEAHNNLPPFIRGWWIIKALP